MRPKETEVEKVMSEVWTLEKTTIMMVTTDRSVELYSPHMNGASCYWKTRLPDATSFYFHADATLASW